MLAGIEALGRRQTGRTPLGDAWPFCQEQFAFLRALPGVTAAEAAGSLRRMRDTVGDLDILVAAADSEPVMDAFASQPIVSHIEGRGATKTSVEFSNGLRAQVWVHPPERFGTALQYATGSKDHNVKVREQALKKGFSLSEHALTREDGSEMLCATEEQVYQAIGLPYIPPELREDRGEVQAGLAGTLPELITLSDIISELHSHSTWSDGRGSDPGDGRSSDRPRPQSAGDHRSQPESGDRQRAVSRTSDGAERRDRELREEFEGRITILHGTEMEIKTDGTLDFPDEVLAELDIVVASLHVGMRQPREQVTETDADRDPQPARRHHRPPDQPADPRPGGV